MEPIKIEDGFYFVGVLDKDLRVFDIVMETEFGTSYNAFLLVGEEKTCLIETVKVKFFDEMLQKVKKALNGRPLDYIIHNHTEPDHSGSSWKMLKEYPDVEIIGSKIGLSYLKEIGNEEVEGMKTTTSESLKDTGLDLGGYTLQFKSAPFLHWPDSIFTYCPELETVFGCDFLGCHMATEKHFDNKLNESERNDWRSAFDYYFGAIFGPFKGYSVKGLDILTKEIGLDNIKYIGTSHGPILTNTDGGLIPEAIDKYYEWSKHRLTPEEKFDEKVTIAYVSAYGFTGEMVEEIIKGIESEGVACKSYDITYLDSLDEITQELTTSKGLLFGSPTILGDYLPNIHQFLALPYINPIISSGQVAGTFGSYGWSGEATSYIDTRLQQLKMELPLDPLKINFKRSEADIAELFEYGVNFAKSVKGEKLGLRTVGKKKKAKKQIEEDIFADEKAWKDDGVVREYECMVCGFNDSFLENPSEYECDGCKATGEIWEEVKGLELSSISPQTTPAVEIEHTCDICGYKGIGEHPEECPLCRQSGEEIWTIEEKPIEGQTAAVEVEKEWECEICGYVHHGEIPPEECPVCRQSGDIWIELETETVETPTSLNTYNGTIAVVGGGIAGVTAVEAIRSYNSDAKVLLFSEEGLPYNRTALSKTTNVVSINKADWYPEHNVELIEERVESVNEGEKTLITTNGTSHSYDKLILATGAHALNPFPIADNIFSIHTVENQQKAISQISGNVVIIGAGVLGVEASAFITNNNQNVESITFIDLASHVLSVNYRDERASEFLREYLEEKGFDFFMNDTVKNFNIVDNKVQSLELLSGKSVECDAVIVNISSRPNLELADQLNLDIEERGIIVDEHMMSSTNDIFAVGDCNSYGLYDNYFYSKLQGQIAGLNSIGIQESILDHSQVLSFNCDVFDFNSISHFSTQFLNEDQPIKNYFISAGEDHFFKFCCDQDNNIVALNTLALQQLNGVNVKKCLNKNVFKVLNNVKRLFV